MDLIKCFDINVVLSVTAILIYHSSFRYCSPVHFSLCPFHHGTHLRTLRPLRSTHAVSHSNLVTNHFDLSFLFLAQLPQIVLLFLFIIGLSSSLSLNHLKSAFCCAVPLVMLQSIFVIRFVPLFCAPYSTVCCISSSISWFWLLSLSHVTL
jgi:hypothetical protein